MCDWFGSAGLPHVLSVQSSVPPTAPSHRPLTFYPFSFLTGPHCSYAVHFPGFGKRDDVTVRDDQLLKLNRETVRQIESIRDEVRQRSQPAKPKIKPRNRKPETSYRFWRFRFWRFPPFRLT